MRESYGSKENWCIYCRDEKSETAYAASPFRLSFCDVVEMVGVEPTSKNISEELSPSAVSALSFAESAVTLTHYGTAIL